MPVKRPSWVCLVPGCAIKGRRQHAATNDQADHGQRIHYLDSHYQPYQPYRAVRAGGESPSTALHQPQPPANGARP